MMFHGLKFTPESPYYSAHSSEDQSPSCGIKLQIQLHSQTASGEVQINNSIELILKIFKKLECANSLEFRGLCVSPRRLTIAGTTSLVATH